MLYVIAAIVVALIIAVCLKPSARKIFLVSGLAIVMFSLSACSADQSASNNSDFSRDVTKAEYQQAQKEHKELVATNSQLDSVLKDTNAQRKQLEDQEDQADQQAQTQQDQSSDQSDQNSGSDQAANQTQPAEQPQQNSGDQTISGGSSQYIIGNTNSHIYHMPGQRGYSMKSKNAVYFSSEQEAINAGYRKAKQ